MTDSKNKTVTLIGEGGAEFEFELPLNAQHAGLVANAQLRPKDPKDLKALKGADGVAGDGQGEPPPTTGKGSGRDEWVEYALSLGMSDSDLENMSKEDIIEAVNHTRAEV